MKKVIVLLSLLLLVILASGFSENKNNSNSTVKFTSSLATVLTEEESFSVNYNIPFTGKSYNGFKNAIAFKESRGRYHVINSLGYLGKYQFGKATLNRLKIYDTNLFLNTPQLQEDAFLALCSINKWILRKDIQRSVGKNINGVKITESGILAAAHLGGAGNVKKYLRSFGDESFKDAYGSSVQHYIKLFSGYDTSFIEANRKPTVRS
tara:strand:- start:4931 stop:5554 length:624 start_codon:yes stop_codon:yes gene_type:complete